MHYANKEQGEQATKEMQIEKIKIVYHQAVVFYGAQSFPNKKLSNSLIFKHLFGTLFS